MPIAFGAVGATILNNNEAPDQEVEHFHVHVIPRFEADNLTIPDPQNAPAPLEVRLRIAEALRRVLNPGDAT